MLHPDALLQNRYRIVRQLGKGGMGTVDEAVDQRLSSIVALKETLSTTDEARRAFEREASLLANLRHRSLPNVTDYFAEGDGQFLVMQFIPGDDLAQLLELRQQPFPVEQVLFWADELLKALEYLHSHTPPILHRDIKPANLKLTREGELFLIDFGLSKGVAGQMPTLLTSRSVKGYTPAYSPLEQIHGGGTDPRSDLYSLGGTLYHLLTNIPPIDPPARFNALDELQPDPLVSANQINREVPVELARILSQAMAMNRRHRPANATAMRQMLRQVAPTSGEYAATSRKQSAPVVLPTQPAETTQPLAPTRQAEISQPEPRVESAQPTIKEVPNLIERPARVPTTSDLSLVSAQTPETTHTGLRVGLWVAAIAIVLVVGLGIGAGLFIPWLAKRRAIQNQATQPANPNIDAQQNLVKPAAVPPRPNFSGEFNVAKALVLVYGSYDAQKKYVKWRLSKDDLAGKGETGINPGTVYTATNMMQSFTQNGAQRYFVITETVPARYNCHACAPFIGGAIFTQVGDNWQLDAASKLISTLGSFGTAPKGKLIKIGPDRYGIIFHEGGMNQGVSGESVIIFSEVGESVQEVLTVGEYSGDNSGDCGEGSLFGTPCWKYSSKMDFEAGANADYFDTKVTTTGTKEDQNGKVRRANEVRKYTFKDGKFVLVK